MTDEQKTNGTLPGVAPRITPEQAAKARRVGAKHPGKDRVDKYGVRRKPIGWMDSEEGHAYMQAQAARFYRGRARVVEEDEGSGEE